MAISFEFDGIELARRTEEKERGLKGIQDDEWSAESSIDRGEGGKIILRSENVHAVEPTNDPHNKAQSIFSWKRKLDNFVDGVLDSLTEYVTLLIIIAYLFRFLVYYFVSYCLINLFLLFYYFIYFLLCFFCSFFSFLFSFLFFLFPLCFPFFSCSFLSTLLFVF